MACIAARAHKLMENNKFFIVKHNDLLSPNNHTHTHTHARLNIIVRLPSAVHKKYNSPQVQSISFLPVYQKLFNILL